MWEKPTIQFQVCVILVMRQTHIDQWTRIESPKIENPYIHGQQIFDKGEKSSCMEEE